MLNFDETLSIFIVLWAVIDPIGTIPVFIAITKEYNQIEKRKIATTATYISFIVLMLFLLIGETILKRVGVPIAAFQTSGGIILFLFALNMIFGDSKPEQEILLVKNGKEKAIFPLAIPSIASPGAILAVVLLVEGQNQSIARQLTVTSVLAFILLINYLLMYSSHSIHKKIGNSGAIVISKVMGLILASMAANNVLVGIKEFFKINA